MGVSARKVNWILDADISKFFDTIEHDWLVKFIEHRVADARVVRLIKKWLHAGVLEDGRMTQSELGTVQGGSISPLLANIYLHYAFDLWVKQWRGRHARGDVIVVRYADDWVAGFQYRDDAERFQREVARAVGPVRADAAPRQDAADRVRALRPREPTPPGTEANRRPSTSWASRTAAGKTRKGKFMVLRLTSAKRLRAKLQARQGRTAKAHAPTHRRAGPVPARGGGRACALLRRARTTARA